MQLSQWKSDREGLPEEHRRSSGVAVSLLVLAFLGLFATFWKDRQTVENIQVAGVSSLSKTAVHLIADSCVSKKCSDVLLADVRARIEKIPFVKNAFVYFSGVRSLTVEVQERIPVASVVLPDGSMRYVDADGVMLPTSNTTHAFNVPLIRCPGKIKGTDLAESVVVLNNAQATLNTDLYQSISELVIDDRGLMTVITDNTKWKLGRPDCDQASAAFQDMNVYWSRQVRTSASLANTIIDLRWDHQIIVSSFNVSEST